MFNKIKNYKLILINKDDASAKEFNSKRLVIFSILSLLTLFVFGAIFFSSNQINDFISLKSIHKHKKNNVKLQKLIEGQQSKINDLMVEIDELNKRDDNMRSLLKLPVIDKDIRKLGVGGSSNNDEDLNSLEYLLPTEVHLKSLKDDIEFLLRTINLEKFSYSEIEEKIYKDQDKLLHYPAIHPISMIDSKFSSGFGYRYDPFTKKRKLHEGHDFSADIGTPIVATANGVVKSSRYFGSFGNYIEIDHGNGFITCYGHLSNRAVKKGAIIERGQYIGKVGNTGRSTAPHLHYEVRYNNKNLDPTNFYFDLSL
tara:strand:- start:300 stop:1235 length:936 start_codon:yes stop_codon:yes gene_type:complete